MKPVEPPPSKPVEPGREERTTRVETTQQPTNRPNPSTLDTLTMVSTRPAPSSQVGSTGFTTSKLVEPGREERTPRVDATRQPTSRPDPSTPDTHKRFRHDQLLRRRSTQPASLLPSWLSRAATNEHSESTPPSAGQHTDIRRPHLKARGISRRTGGWPSPVR